MFFLVLDDKQGRIASIVFLDPHFSITPFLALKRAYPVNSLSPAHVQP
jgi:hypothetical protein